MPDPTPETDKPQPGNRRTEEFLSLYANNVQFESSVWDLKLILGELDQSRGQGSVEQHTSLTIPWQQARLMAYFLIVNTSIYEATNGKIPFPLQIVPSRPDPADEKLDDTGRRVLTYLAWVHDQFFGSDPYIPPELGELLRQQQAPTATTEAGPKS